MSSCWTATEGACCAGKPPTASTCTAANPADTGGPSNDPSNLITLCAADRAWVRDDRDQAIEMGLLLHPTDNPRAVPVAHHWYGAVYLLPDGTVTHPPDWDRR